MGDNGVEDCVRSIVVHFVFLPFLTQSLPVKAGIGAAVGRDVGAAVGCDVGAAVGCEVGV